MKTKASVLTLRVPLELKHKIERIADEQGLSINQLALYTFAKEIKEIETFNYLSRYWKGEAKTAIFRDFDAVIARVKRGSPPDWDKME
jgi:hypothetical protein